MGFEDKGQNGDQKPDGEPEGGSADSRHPLGPTYPPRHQNAHEHLKMLESRKTFLLRVQSGSSPSKIILR